MKKKIFNIFCILLIVIFAGLAFFMMSKKMQNKIVFVGGKAVVWVMTGSMEDIIPAQSYILIKEVKDAEKEIEPGMIITFYSSDSQIAGKLNTHEVVRIDRENGCFTTKGSNNLGEDSATVPYKDVEGIYVRNLPVLTALGRFFITPFGFVCVMAALLGLICAIYLPDTIRAIKGKDKEKTAEAEFDKQSEIERRIAEEVEKLKEQDRRNHSD